MSSIGARVGRSNKVVADIDAGINGLNSWLSPTTDVFTSAGDSRRYINDSVSLSAQSANSGLSFATVVSPTLLGPRKTSVGPELVLVFNNRSL